jgi:hypothetical protein
MLLHVIPHWLDQNQAYKSMHNTECLGVPIGEANNELLPNFTFT